MLASPVNELPGTNISADFAKQIQKEVSNFEGNNGLSLLNEQRQET